MKNNASPWKKNVSLNEKNMSLNEKKRLVKKKSGDEGCTAASDSKTCVS